MKMSLVGEDWPEDWAVPYSYLESWGLLSWFDQPPAEGEGLQADRAYKMSNTPQPEEFAAILDSFGELVGQIKPMPTSVQGVRYVHTEEY
jgi:hypothetical protein